jgi:hypothetical protein
MCDDVILIWVFSLRITLARRFALNLFIRQHDEVEQSTSLSRIPISHFVRISSSFAFLRETSLMELFLCEIDISTTSTGFRNPPQFEALNSPPQSKTRIRADFSDGYRRPSRFECSFFDHFRDSMCLGSTRPSQRTASQSAISANSSAGHPGRTDGLP